MNEGKPESRRSGKTIGTLSLISILFLGSAAIRLGLEAGPVIAKETSEPEQVARPDAAADIPTEAELLQLLEAFQVREDAIRKREIEVEDRMKALEIAEKAIEVRLASLVEAEAQLSATLTLADGASEDDLARLTTVYENMKPKESARLFEEMAPEFAAGFLARMRPDAAAGIMAGLSPETAYTISVIMAGRNATVPKE